MANVRGIKTSKYLKWLKEFNFYAGIKQMSFRTEMNRSYETSRIRNNSVELTGVYSDMLIQTQAQKNWNWTRNYSVKYDLTKNLKTDFTASNIAPITAAPGSILVSNPAALPARVNTFLNADAPFSPDFNNGNIF